MAKDDALRRFSVAMPAALLEEFDRLVECRGLSKNRSEVIRDLVRDEIDRTQCATPGTPVFGSLMIVFDHHSNDLQEKLHAIQHDSYGTIVSTMHVHADADTCLEVIVLRGENGEVRALADRILGTRGVRNGQLVLTNIDAATEHHHHEGNH